MINDEVVWLYQVIDHENMSCEELQKALNKWSDSPTPNELLVCGDKMIIKFQSALTRNAFFKARRNTMSNAASDCL